MTTDRALRNTERPGATRAERLTALRRAGLLDDAAIRLAAFCGDEWARGTGVDWAPVNTWTLPPGTKRVLLPEDTMPAPDWLAGLERLVAKRSGEWATECPHCDRGSRLYQEGYYECDQCNETGRITMPHSTRTMIVAAVASARVARGALCGCVLATLGGHYMPCFQASRAIEAAEAYLAEPTSERREACNFVVRNPGRVVPLAVLTNMIQAAASVAGFDAVRPAVCAAVIGEVLDGL